MAQLRISLLGPIQVMVSGTPVTGFKSNKVRALLAYLAMEADKPHRRQFLAGLLWPNWPEREALSNLRYALSDLRRAIGDRQATPPFLIISRSSIQFNTTSDYCLDASSFINSTRTEKSAPTFIEEQEKAVGLYRGSFLEGFSVDDSPAFDEWTLLTRERLAQQASVTLHTLADFYEERGEYEKAQSHAWRHLELEPWAESAHQLLMRVMALSGQRSTALAQYETCRKLLKEELDVEPSEETKKMYEQIRAGKLKPLDSSSIIQLEHHLKLPSFIDSESPQIETPILVARESELEKITGLLEQTLAGQGRVVFVTGEVGSGKTSLLQEFIRRSQDANEELLVASGDCNAYTGMGDPYLPFREILELLTGDVEARWAAGTITKDHTLRLWNSLPLAIHAIVQVGPDLIDTFVQRTALLGHAKACASGQSEWLTDLEEFVEQKPATLLSAAALHQVDLFEQYTRVLQTLEHKSPLLLVIDDLQWADAGSINLLFHLGRRLKDNRILILGAFRPEEVAFGRDGGRHPLEPMINEFRMEFGDIILSVDQIDARKFIEALLNTEPHRLGPSFHEMLYHQTQGHPLFTIELLRGLQERGDLSLDSDGYWIEGTSLDWVTLPVRVEAAIQERIKRLPESLQKALTVASVEGESFTAEVVAQVMGIDIHEMLEYLSGELDRKHHLVHAQSIQRMGGRPISRYRFRHILFQKYLYRNLDEVERVHLHEQVGSTLEELYKDQVEDASNPVHLALHFEKAKIIEKATYYLLNAGKRALQLSAYRDGITHIEQGLSLLEDLPDSGWRSKQELDLLLALGIAWQGTLGAQQPEVEDVLTKARDLCQKVGNTNQMVQVLGGLVVLYYVRGKHHRAQELAEEGLALAEKANDPLLIMFCHWYLGFIFFCFGDYLNALKHLHDVLDSYEANKHHHPLVLLRGSDAGLGAMAYAVCCLWSLGYPDQALKQSKDVMALARELGHPFSLADVLCFAGCLFHEMRRDGESLAADSEELMQIAKERNLAGWFATGMRYQGIAFILQGKIQEGANQVRKGISAMQFENIWIYSSGTLASLAEIQIKAGYLDEASATLDEAFAMVEKTDECYWKSELYRLKGELLLKEGDDIKAEVSYQKAIEIARKQSAKSLELRAVMSLCRLWEKQGNKTEARQMLAEIYNWFTEGFDTPDLIEAKELYQELQIP